MMAWICIRGGFGAQVRQFHSTLVNEAKKKRISKYQRALERVRRHMLRRQEISKKTVKIDPILAITSLEGISGKYSYGVSEEEKTRLEYGAAMANVSDIQLEDQVGEAIGSSAARSPALTLEKEELKAEAVDRILNLRNANAPQVRKALIDFAIEQFQKKEGDVGSSGVQAAVLTVRIQLQYRHYIENLKDYKAVHHLRDLVQARQRILRYYKQDDPDGYYACIERLGLTDEIVMERFEMSRKGRMQFNPEEVGRHKIRVSKRELKEQQELDSIVREAAKIKAAERKPLVSKLQRE
ncbi:hypothetical protein CANCADRAFT_46269 [Tortispora caseinolytica NRRL Y-17796]|uniref:Ribosomal protein S15 n=1 Tax=Tortispora caseinolytica NRRL Y-17796 TaxID=767744 RepID=A0A1E4T9F0_9ASCO|nr:hypothetical protein CANCADRAFT_46269 [Tortispora caseinolytica NRRL Y-17796]